jgi:hypothetical protein
MKELFGRKPVRHPEVLWREIQGETLLLRLDTGRPCVLNRVGGSVWSLMDGEKSLQDIVPLVGQDYAVDRERLEADIAAFVEALQERGLLSWGGEEA